VRTILYYAAFWLYHLVCIPHLWFAVLAEWTGHRDFARRFAVRQAARWCRFQVWMSGSDLEILGLDRIPPTGGALIVANHQGAFDIPILLGFLGRPVAFVAKKELRRIPMLGSWMVRIGCQFLDRESRRQALETFQQSVAALRDGQALIIFPEGTRSRSESMGPFHKGSLRMAVDAGVPVIPATLVDTFRMREAQGGRIRPVPVRLVIDDPIDPTRLSREDQGNLAEHVRGIIARSLEEHRLTPADASPCPAHA